MISSSFCVGLLAFYGGMKKYFKDVFAGLFLKYNIFKLVTESTSCIQIERVTYSAISAIFMQCTNVFPPLLDPVCSLQIRI